MIPNNTNVRAIFNGDSTYSVPVVAWDPEGHALIADDQGLVRANEQDGFAKLDSRPGRSPKKQEPAIPSVARRHPQSLSKVLAQIEQTQPDSENTVKKALAPDFSPSRTYRLMKAAEKLGLLRYEHGAHYSLQPRLTDQGREFLKLGPRDIQAFLAN